MSLPSLNQLLLVNDASAFTDGVVRCVQSSQAEPHWATDHSVACLLQSILIDSHACSLLQLDRMMQPQNSSGDRPPQQPLFHSMLGAALSHHHDPTVRADMMANLRLNIQANGFDLAASPTASHAIMLRAVDCVRLASQPSSGPQALPAALSLCHALMAQASFEPSMLRELPGDNDSSMLASIGERRMSLLRHLLRAVLRQWRHSPDDVDLTRLLDLIVDKCAAMTWQFEEQTGETPVNEVFESQHIGLLLRLLLSPHAPSLASLPLASVGHVSATAISHTPTGETIARTIPLTLTWDTEFGRFSMPQVCTPHRLCGGVIEALIVWQAAQGNQPAKAAMQSGSEEEQQTRRDRIVEACGEEVESLNEQQLRDRLSDLQHTLPQWLASHTLAQRLKACWTSRVFAPDARCYDHAACHSAVDDLLATLSGIELESSIGCDRLRMDEQFLLPELLAMPTHELERLAPFESSIMRQLQRQPPTESELRSIDVPSMISAHTVPHREDCFAWRLWRAALCRLRAWFEAASSVHDHALIPLHNLLQHLRDLAVKRLLAADATSAAAESSSIDCSLTQPVTAFFSFPSGPPPPLAASAFLPPPSASLPPSTSECCDAANATQIEHIFRFVDLICASLGDRMCATGRWYKALVTYEASSQPVLDAMQRLHHQWIERHPNSTDLFCLVDSDGVDQSLLGWCERSVRGVRQLIESPDMAWLARSDLPRMPLIQQLAAHLRPRRDQWLQTTRQQLQQPLLPDLAAIVLNYCAAVPSVEQIAEWSKPIIMPQLSDSAPPPIFSFL